LDWKGCFSFVSSNASNKNFDQIVVDEIESRRCWSLPVNFLC